MASRLERLYKEEPDKRTKQNEEMYEETDSKLRPVTIEHTKQIDIRELKKIIEKREESKRTRASKSIMPEERRNLLQGFSFDDDFTDNEKDYDINNVLEKAKEDRSYEEKLSNKKLRSTSYDILSNLDIEVKRSKKEEVEEEIKEVEDDVQELIDTISMTAVKNSSSDSLFDELKDTAVLENVKSKKKDDLDDSFFTSKVKLKKEELPEENGENKIQKTSGVLIKLLVGLLVIVTIAVIYFIVTIFFL